MAIIISPIIRLVLKIASGILFLITFLAAYSGLVDPRIISFPAFLTLVFPWLAIASFVVAVIWIVSGRWIIGAAGIAMLFACWGPLSMAVPLKFKSSSEPGERTFKLLTYNICHTWDQKHPEKKGTRALRYLMDSDADIICLQEFTGFDANLDTLGHHNAALIDSLKARYPYRIIPKKWPFTQHDQTILSRYPVEKLEGIVDEDQPDSWTRTFYRVNIGGTRITIADVHLISFALSNDERKVLTGIHDNKSARNSLNEMKGPIRWKMSDAYRHRANTADNIAAELKDIKGPLIVCGDFNDVPGSWTYRTFIDEGLKDAFAETHFGPMHTYNAHLMLFHLDQILYRGPLRALSTERGDVDSSDHYPVLATFAITRDKNN